MALVPYDWNSQTLWGLGRQRIGTSVLQDSWVGLAFPFSDHGPTKSRILEVPFKLCL